MLLSCNERYAVVPPKSIFWKLTIYLKNCLCILVLAFSPCLENIFSSPRKNSYNPLLNFSGLHTHRPVCTQPATPQQDNCATLLPLPEDWDPVIARGCSCSHLLRTKPLHWKEAWERGTTWNPGAVPTTPSLRTVTRRGLCIKGAAGGTCISGNG